MPCPGRVEPAQGVQQVKAVALGNRSRRRIEHRPIQRTRLQCGNTARGVGAHTDDEDLTRIDAVLPRILLHDAMLGVAHRSESDALAYEL